MNKKIIAFVLATALLAGVIAPAVGAEEEVTIESLQKVIAELVATIASLRSQLGGQTTPVATGLCLTSDLSQGMTSAEVKILQQGLNQNVATQVAAAGAGAAGAETTYFGPLTKTAVVKFQELYASEVLTPGGLAKGTGFAGPATRAKFNALFCSPVTPPTTVPGEEPGIPETGIEGTLSVSTAAVYTETSLKWGTSNQTVYAFKVKAKNSDILLKRINLKLTGTNLIPWKDLSHISLYEGDDAIKGVEVTKANLIENDYAADYDVYFNDLNITIGKDAEKTFVVKVTTLSNPENKTPVTISLPANGIRGVDGAKLQQYNTSAVPSKTISYEGLRDTGELQVKNNSTTPKEGVIIGSKTATTKDQIVFKFDVKAVNNNITLKEAGIELTQSASTLLSAVYLFDGDNRLASEATVATTSAQTITFSGLTVEIAKDTTKTFTVKVDLAKVDGSIIPEGSTVTSISVKTATFKAIDANDNNVSNITGSAAGYNQSVYTVAPVFALSSAKLTIDPNTSTKAVADFVFTVTGSGDTIYIKNDATWFNVNTSDHTKAVTGTPLVYADKTATGGYYEINSAETVKFTVSIDVSVEGAGGMVYAVLDEVNWNTIASTTGSSIASGIADLSNWRTNGVNMY